MVIRVMRFLTIALVGLSLLGCATYYKVKVNGYTAPETTGQIKPGGFFFIMEGEGAKNPLLEQEIKGKITKLLEMRGYPVTTKFDKADYYLFYAYGMGEPRSVGVPEYSGSIGLGGGWGGGWGWGGRGGYGWGGIGVPLYGGTDVVTLYDRWLQINVVEGAPYRGQKLSHSVWVGEARSSGASSDLRTNLNYLLIALFGQFGKNTGKAITVDLKQNDPAVYSLSH
jgi:Domain of unknown function (DUF4136)